MNQTVELVKLWGEYEAAQPNATIEGFCRQVLTKTIKKEKAVTIEIKLLPDINGQLIKTISRIGKFHELYTNKALAGTGLDQIEEFGILTAIFNRVNPTKSEAILTNMLELSSGTNILIKLKAKKLITEYTDSEDKRVKRLQLTAKGEQIVKAARQQILKVVALLTHDLSEDDKQLCLQLLSPIDKRFFPLVQKQKNKTFEEVLKHSME